MTRLSLRPTIATIPPTEKFLDTLAAWWLSRTATAPLACADGLFLLPTRRAARGLADAFLRQAEGRPLLLPRIVALGAIDEAPLAMAGALDLAQAVPEPTRLAALTRLVLALEGAQGAPREAARAWQLAGELATLLDEAARAEIGLAEALPKAVAAEFAAHWNVTLDFLKIVTHAWPAWLAENGYADPARRQLALLDAQTEAWTRTPPPTPVIAAGTTGAIPAVGRLLKLVAYLPQGMVILPGLDQALDQASWESLEPSHPQASLRNLLVLLDARREDVLPFSAISGASLPPAAPAHREALLRQALLPAGALAQWQTNPAPADTGFFRLDAADQQEEALAIALLLRDALETPGQRAALVTPDRALARRVAAELLRFGVIADDSAGEDLAETPPAVFLRLLAQAAADSLRPVPLLSLLKHPFAAAGLNPAACRDAARRLERAALRGPRPAPGLAGLRDTKADPAFLDRIASTLAPLLDLGEDRNTPAAQFTALLQAAEALAATDQSAGAQILWAGEDGEALAGHLSLLLDAMDLLPPQPLRALPPLLDAVLAGQAVRTRRALRGREGSEHPRVFIWGLLEARLQTADVIILGGLSEGVWPPLGESGPWMNRAMRQAVGLPSPEEKLGLAAHDFVMASCAAPVAVLSAPRRRDRAPAVPSRWIVRLDAMLAGQGGALPRHPAPSWAQAIDRPEGAARPVQPPAPCPPMAARPRRLSVTEIETFLRDPYAIYAKHVLRLKKLPPLEEAADAADYGSIVHDGLARFFARNGRLWPADARAQLTADMAAALAEKRMRPALAAWWRPRLHRIASWVADAERDRRAAGAPLALHAEKTGDWLFGAPAGPFTLHGRADRIERRADGAWAILDYKTGTPPSAAQVEDGLAPQLPLEAAMLARGAFGAELAGEIGELTYWHISGGFEPGKVLTLFKGDEARTREVTAEADARVQALVAAFDDAAQPYLSQPSPGAAPRFSDYTVLARVAEWAAADES
jgi:ATP-dependent helicase/nuclease subunit B